MFVYSLRFLDFSLEDLIKQLESIDFWNFSKAYLGAKKLAKPINFLRTRRLFQK